METKQNIPKQLQHSDFRFVLLGKWNVIRNKKTKVLDFITPENYKQIKESKEWDFLGKAPFETAWQKKGYKFDSPKLLNHKDNFGVIGGHGNLRILDIDNKKLAEEFEKKLNTYTVKTGSGGRHFYFISDYNTNHVLINELGELRADNYQAVSAPCRHSSGNYYEVINDVPIQTISKEDLLNLIKPYLREENQTIESKIDNNKEDTSRSGLEYRKVLALLRERKTREEIYKIMGAYSKWASSTEQYRSLTFEKAENFYLQNNADTNVIVSNNTATPILPTTPYYIKSWGIYDKEKQILIEQIESNTFYFDIKNKKGLVQINKFDKGFEIDGNKFIFRQKNIYESKLFYNTPSIDLVQRYIEGKYKPRVYTEINKEIVNNLKILFDFKSEVDVQTSSLCIGQSWIKPKLNQFFFYGIDSTLGGGKTTLGEIVYFLMRHGFLGGNISSASIPRLTDELDLNIFIDEIDQNIKDDDVMAILRKGQRRGNPYVRCEGRDNRPVAYDLAGIHGFSFRSELEDAFMNRALRIHSVKSFDYMLPVINSAKKEVLKPLADELFIWYLDNILNL